MMNQNRNDDAYTEDVLCRLRDWTRKEKEMHAKSAKELDDDPYNENGPCQLSDLEWQKYCAFNAVQSWAEEELRKIYNGR